MEYAFDVFVNDPDDQPPVTIKCMPATHLIAIWPPVKELLPTPGEGEPSEVRNWNLELIDRRIEIQIRLVKIIEPPGPCIFDSPGEFRNE